MPVTVSVTVVPPAGAVAFRVAVTVTGSPPSAGSGSALSVRAVGAPSLSVMVSVRVFAVSFGLVLVASMMMVSPGSTTGSSRIVIVDVPLVAPAAMWMEVEDTW